jgi:hypothetical protein
MRIQPKRSDLSDKVAGPLSRRREPYRELGQDEHGNRFPAIVYRPSADLSITDYELKTARRCASPTTAISRWNRPVESSPVRTVTTRALAIHRPLTRGGMVQRSR